MYRWFVHDPVRFRRSIRWTIEHGHANNFENDYSSVAYWYQTEPHKPFPVLPADRLPPGEVAAAKPAPGIPGLIEAEDLIERTTRFGGNVAAVRPGTPFSRGAVAVLFATSADAWIVFPIRVEAAGRFRIGAHLARASDLGRWRLSIDGRPLGPEVDLYNGQGGHGPTHVIPTGEVIFGEIDLTAGEHELKFQCVGKNERSSGHFFAADGFVLQPVR